jgi:hypothetical protein
VKQLEREASGITWKDQMWFSQKFSIRLVEFEAWRHAMSIQQIRKTIEQHVIHFGYPMLNLVSHLPQSILRMGSGNDYPTNNSESLHPSNVKEAYRSTNEVNCIQQMLKFNDQCTGRDYMEETLSSLAH